jgi:hypothetical protein
MQGKGKFLENTCIISITKVFTTCVSGYKKNIILLVASLPLKCEKETASTQVLIPEEAQSPDYFPQFLQISNRALPTNRISFPLLRYVHEPES